MYILYLRDDDQEEEQTERPSKKPRFDLSYSDSPGKEKSEQSIIGWGMNVTDVL